MAQGLSKAQFLYALAESIYGTIPNTAGTASFVAANACRFESLTTDGDQSEVVRPDKTGYLSAPLGAGGRKSAGWTAKMSMAGNGVAGTKPDCDPFLQAAFGKAGVFSPGVSCTYGLDDLSPSLSIFNARDPATLTQQIALGSVVKTMKIPLGQDNASLEFSGPARWVLDSTAFATSDTIGKGGLTAFPVRPPSPVYNGNMALGFLGTVTIDGQAYGTFRSGNINCDFGRELPQDVYNSYYGNLPGQDVRNITVDWTMYDDDSANLIALKIKAMAKTPVNLVFVIGTTAGNIWTWTVKQVVLDVPKYDDSARNYAVKMSGKAHPTADSAKDELGLVIT